MHFTAYLESFYRSVDGKNPGKGKSFFLLFTFLFLTFCLRAQTFELHLKKASLANVFKKVEAQSSYRFIYTREEVEAARPISGTISGGTIKEVLELIFRDQPLTYLQEGHYIRVVQKPMEAAPKGIDVTGIVINEKGEALPGASVQVRGSVNATATNAAGEFYLEDIQPNDVLLVSSIGYSSSAIALHGNTNVLVRLELLVSSLDETVVIAYGTTTRRLNTGSVGRVTSKEIERQPVSNPIAALQGRVSGLFITQGNGLPGANFSVLIRGRNSIQSGTSPLYVIDGVPFLNDAERLTQRSSLNANNPFNTINPLDIESIEVLKDADATAIYGSRGTNGVILITTKKAGTGKTALDLHFTQGWGKVTRTVNYLDTKQYLAMRREAFRNDGMTPTMSNAGDLLAWDTSRYTDWKKYFIGGTAHTSKATARLNGGNAQTNFSLGADYYRETTVFPGKLADEIKSVSLSVHHRSPSKKFSADMAATYGLDKNRLASTDLTTYASLPPNLYALKDSAGKYVWQEGGVSGGNPLAKTEDQYTGITNRLTANSQLAYLLLPGLSLKASLGYNGVRFEETALSPIIAQNPALLPQGGAGFGNNTVTTWISEPQVSYQRALTKKGKIDLLLGSTWQETAKQSQFISAFGYTSDDLIRSISGATTVTAQNAQSLYRYQSLFGKVNYNHVGTYLFNLTGRRDVSSRFGPKERSAIFGAAGASWIFTNEKWMKRISSVLNFGKLRGSYGLTGNDQIGDYQFFDSYTATRYPYSGITGLRPSRLFNPDYSWEESVKAEGALELAFFKSRLQINTNWYRTRTRNQIIQYNLPAQTGFTEILRNFPGVVENRGMEFEVSTVNMRSKILLWTTSANLTMNRNRLLSFPGLETSSYASTYFIGESLNVLYGYRYLGVDPQTGIYTFDDVNKDGIISGPSGSSMNDYVRAGVTTPDFYGGLNNLVTYKGLELSFLFQFVKQQGYQPLFRSPKPPGSYLNNQPVTVLDRWQKPGDRAIFSRYTQNFSNPAYFPAMFNLANSDAVLTDASFIRLKNLSLSYSLPQVLLVKKKISGLRVFVQGQNLVTFTHYKGSDPENQSLTSLPPLKVLSIGFQITF